MLEGGSCGLVYLVNASLGTSKGQPGYLASADINGDGVVNGVDLALALAQVPNGVLCELDEVAALLASGR
jgi:hypothetical protein